MTDRPPESSQGEAAGDDLLNESRQVIRRLVTEIQQRTAELGFAGAQSQDPPARGSSARGSSASGRAGDRQRVHTLLDQALDLGGEAKQAAESIARGFAGLAREMRTTSSRSQPRDAPATGAAPVLDLPAGRPGETTTGYLDVENTGLAGADVRLGCQVMLGPGTERIVGAWLELSPTVISLAPGAMARVRVALRIPADARPGTYRGIVEAAGLPDVQLMVRVSVV